MKKRTLSDIEEFMALPDSEKEKIAKELDDETTDQMLANSLPLNKKDQAKWKTFKQKANLTKPRKTA